MTFSSDFIENTITLKRYNYWRNSQSSGIPTPHYFLSSFPRSANGWVRVVLASIFIASKGFDVHSLQLKKKTNEKGVKYDCLISGKHEFDVEDILPDMYMSSLNLDISASKISNVIKQLDLPFTIVKTHHIVDCARQKTVFLFREPLSCLTSASLLLNPEEIKKIPESINQTILYFSDYYLSMLNHYLEQKNSNSDNCFLLSHDLLSSDSPAIQYKKLVEFLGFNSKLAVIEEILKQFPLRSGYNKELSKLVTDETKAIVMDMFSVPYSKAVNYAKEDALLLQTIT